MSMMTKPEAAATNGLQVLQPSGWPQPKGYANGIMAEGRLVVTGGVVGWDVAGRTGLSRRSGRRSKTSSRSWPKAARGRTISCA
jgi:hypothetical protein